MKPRIYKQPNGRWVYHWEDANTWPYYWAKTFKTFSELIGYLKYEDRT